MSQETIVEATNLKVVLPFKAGNLPAVDPANPMIKIKLGKLNIMCKISPKAARKLAIHAGSAVLQGRLMFDGGGSLVLSEAGFQFVEQRPAEPVAGGAVAAASPIEELAHGQTTHQSQPGPESVRRPMESTEDSQGRDVIGQVDSQGRVVIGEFFRDDTRIGVAVRNPDGTYDNLWKPEFRDSVD